MAKLTPKQAMFCKEYIVDLNATQACIRAGYSSKGANSKGAQLLAKISIQAEIQRLMNKRSAKLEITQDMVLRELAKLGFSNMQNLYDDSGQLIPVHMLDKDVSASLQEVTEEVTGSAVLEDGTPVQTIKRKYKTAEKKASLDLIGRHLKMFTDRVEQETTLTVTRKQYKEE